MPAARAADVPSIGRRLAAEALGTGLLVMAVIGSGIAASRLSPQDVGLQLLENAAATGCALAAIIVALGPVSGAHLNPIVSVVDGVLGGLRMRDIALYAGAQVTGGALGALAANAMFSLPTISVSAKVRGGGGLVLSETIATVGLLLVIFGIARSGRAAVAPFAVGGYISGAYFFTSSTSFANPAVTVARSLSNTFAGIAPRSIPAFLVAQFAGGGIGILLVRFLHPRAPETSADVVVPHENSRRDSQ